MNLCKIEPINEVFDGVDVDRADTTFQCDSIRTKSNLDGHISQFIFIN